MEFLDRMRTRAAQRRVGDWIEQRHSGLCSLQDDMSVANGSGATVRVDLNSQLQSLVTLSSGASAPATPYAHQLWADTTANVLRKRNAANSGWIIVRTLDEAFVLSRSSNTILGVSDVGKTITATAGFTQTLTAAATLGDGWWINYRVESGAILVFDPNASENIDSAATKVVMGPSSGILFCTGSAFFTVGFAPFADNSVCDFRLSLTSGLAVTTADVTGASTLYATPRSGNRIALYDGIGWNIRTSAQFSIALSGLTSGLPYDVFVYDNAGVPTLELAAWSSDSARVTSLFYQDGILSKSGSVFRRYLGTFYTTATTTTEDSEANRYLFNYYHRASRLLRKIDATASWTNTSASWAQMNASTANQCNVMIGVAEDATWVQVNGAAQHSSVSGAAAYVGIGIDSTSVNSATTAPIPIHAAGAQSGGGATYSGVLAAGKHSIKALEYALGATTTFYGTSGATLSGLVGEVMA